MLKAYTAAKKEEFVSEHFSVGDFWTDNGYKTLYIDDQLFPVLEVIYKQYNVKPRLRNKNNGTDKAYAPQPSASYRPTGTTYHKYTTALDIEVPGIEAVDLARYCETLSCIAGVGLYVQPSERHKQTHIHIDVKRSADTYEKARPSRTCWWILTSGSRTPGHGGVPCVLKKPLIGKGSRSIAVYDLQVRLNADGYGCGVEDGVFGTKTKAALKAWQKAHGITADGVFYKETNKAMGLFAW